MTEGVISPLPKQHMFDRVYAHIYPARLAPSLPLPGSA